MSILEWAFCGVLFSAPLPIPGFCVDHHLLHKTFLVSVERCSNLWMLVLVTITSHIMQNDLTKTPLHCSLSLWTQKLLSKLLTFMTIFFRMATANRRWQESESQRHRRNIAPLRMNKLTPDKFRFPNTPQVPALRKFLSGSRTEATSG